jgi:putative hemolysin
MPKRYLFYFLFFLWASLSPIGYVSGQQCDCPNPGTNFSTPVGEVNLNPNISNGNGPTGCAQYQQINGFVAGRKYVFSFCPDKFQGAKFPQGVPLLLLLKNAANQTVGFSNPNNTNCNAGGYTLEMTAPSTGPLRAYVFSMPGCSTLTPNSSQAQNTQFGYKEDCNKGTLEKQGETCPFTLVYKNPSGAQNYQLQYWNGSNWVNYERAGNRQPWQNTSPNYVFPNVVVKRATSFRVLHLGGSCNSNEFSNEITLDIPPQCPTHLHNNLSITSGKTKYCTNGTLDLKLEEDCLPESGINFEWMGPGTNLAEQNRSSISFRVPDNINPPTPCSSYSYQARVTFQNIPGCTLVSRAHSVQVCKILGFTLQPLPPDSGKICQNQETRLEIVPDRGWTLANFEEATQNYGYSFTWNCNGCNGGNPSRNTMRTNPLSWRNNCGNTVNVAVIQNIDGCQSANPANYQVDIRCQGNANFRVSQNRACVGAPVDINAIEMPAPAGVNYIWDCDGCQAPPPGSAGPHTLSWSTPGVKNIRLTATSLAPCTTEVTSTQVVTVDLPPNPATVSLNCGAPHTPLCVDARLPISVEPQGAGYNYSWNCDGCRPAPTSGASHNLSWSSAGTKTVTVTALSLGCPDVVVTLTCNPVVVKAPSATSTPDTIHNSRFCAKQTLTLSGPDGAGLAYKWELNNQEVGAERRLSLENLPPGAYTLSLTVTNPTLPAQCNVNRMDTPIRFTVSAPPTLNTSSLPEKLCQNKTERLLLDVKNPQNANLTYTWDCQGCHFAGGSNRNSPSPWVSWSAPGAKTLSVTVKSADCPKDSTATVTINVMQIPSFSLSSSLTPNTPLCQGSALIATANYDSSANTRFEWFLDWLPSVKTRSIRLENLAPKMNYRLEVRVTDSNLPQACRELRDTADFRVSPRPNCSFKLSRATISLPDTIRLFDFNANQTAGAIYTWSFDGGTPAAGDDPSPTSLRRVIQYNTPGTKTISFTVETPGCPPDTCTKTLNVVKCDNRDFRFTLKTEPYCPGGSPEGFTMQNALARFNIKWSVVLPNASKENLPQGQTPEDYVFSAGEGRYTFEAAVEDPEFPVCTTFTGARQEAVVYPAPKLTGLTPSQRRCQNVPILFTPAPDGLPATSTYAWKYDGQATIEQGETNRSVPLSLSWAAAGVYEVKLTEETQRCGQAEAKYIVTVLPNPVAQNVELKTLRRCPTPNGEEITLLGEPEQPSYVVDIYDAAQGGNRLRRLRKHSPEWSFSLTASQTYHYEILDTISGCGSPSRASKEIKAQKLQVYNARATQGYCENDSANFIAFPFLDVENNPIPIRWSAAGPSGAIPIANPQSYGPVVINWGSQGIYTVTLSAEALGCPVFTQTIEVRVVKRPSFLIQRAAENETCVGALLSFSATANDVNPPGSLTYEWQCQGCVFTPPNPSTLGPIQVSWTSPGQKILRLIAKGSPCGELIRETFVDIKQPPVPVACNYPRLICEPSPVTITFSGLPFFQEIELFTSYLGGEKITLPYTYPNGNKVELKNRNEAHFWVQATDTVFYGVRDLYSNCPSFYRLPIVLNYDTTNRIPPPTVLNSPIPVCRQSATPLTFRVRPGENSPQQWVYFIAGIRDTLHKQSARERQITFQTPAPITTTTTFYVQVRDTVTGCNSLRIPAIVRVYDPAPPRLHCPARCGPGAVTFTITPTEIGPVDVYATAEATRPIATLNAPLYEFTTPPLTTSTVFFFEQAVGELLGCRSLTRTRCEAVINAIPRPPVPDAVSKKICPPMEATFRFPFSELPNAELQVYDNNGHLLETLAPHPDSARMTFRTPPLNGPARYFVSYREPETGCESQRIPLSIELEEHPRITEITHLSADCGGEIALFTVSHSRSVDSLIIAAHPPLPNASNPSRIAASSGGVTTFTYQLPVGATTIAILPFNRHCGFGPPKTRTVELYPSIRLDLYSERNPNNPTEFCIVARGAGGRSGTYEYQITGPELPNPPNANTRNTTGRFCDPRIKTGVYYTVNICDPYYTAQGRNTCCADKRIRIFSDFMRAQNVEGSSPAIWRLYPNPTRSAFTLQREGQTLNPDEVYRLEIFSALGRALATFAFSAAEPEWSFELPPSFSQGMYAVQVRDSNGRVLFQQRLLLQR